MNHAAISAPFNSLILSLKSTFNAVNEVMKYKTYVPLVTLHVLQMSMELVDFLISISLSELAEIRFIEASQPESFLQQIDHFHLSSSAA